VLVSTLKGTKDKKVESSAVKALRTLTSGAPEIRKTALDAGAKSEWVAK
jgi:hypothetical protein